MAQSALFHRDWAKVDNCIVQLLEQKLADWTILSEMLIIRGRPDDAVRHQRNICRAEPLSPGASLILQTVLGCAKRFEEAESEYLKSRQIPFAANAQNAMNYEAFKRALARGDMQTARDRLLPYLDKAHFLSHGAHLARAIDDRTEALALLRSELRESAAKNPLGIMQVAHLALYYGAEDLALEATRIAYIDIGLHYFPLVDIWHPCFASLHNTAGFKAQLEEIGLIRHCRQTGDWGEYLKPVGDHDFEVVF